MSHETLNKTALTNVCVFTLAFELIFTGGYIAVAHHFPRWQICAIVLICIFVFLSFVCSNLFYILIVKMREYKLSFVKKMRRFFKIVKSEIKEQLGYIICFGIFLLILIVLFFIDNKQKGTTSIHNIISFGYSLLATLLGVLLLCKLMHPRLVIEKASVSSANKHLLITISNHTFFKVYDVKICVFFSKSNSRTKTISIVPIPMRTQGVESLSNRFMPRKKNAFMFSSADPFEWKDIYPKMTIRVSAIHGISNTKTTFEKEYSRRKTN